MRCLIFKRSFDILIVLLLLPILIPLILLLSLIVRFKLGAPVFFVQTRPGLNARPFNMIKFRTMSTDVDSQGSLLPDKKRLCSFGLFLRASSLDELPEVFNVLKGDMSLVGPRPLLMEYLPLYSQAQFRRHDVLPGLTGWAQVNGRNAISWEDKFKLDTWYVDNRSFLLDVKILLLTIRKVLQRDGISADEAVTMQNFTGTFRD